MLSLSLLFPGLPQGNLLRSFELYFKELQSIHQALKSIVTDKGMGHGTWQTDGSM